MDNKNLYNYCHVAERTDVGCKRKTNEDFLDHFVCENGLVSVVCDGMGGHVGGAVASHVAVEAIRNFLCGTFIDDPKVAISKAIDVANEAILTRAMTQPELTGMGSTCVMLIVRDGKVYIGSVGDSRVYLVRERKIRQLTKDQSYVQMLVDRGQLSPEDAERHPRKNEITNALGIQGMKPATVLPNAIFPEAGDCFLLCSDGLSGMVTDDEIQRIVSKQTEMGSQERADTLVELARRNGGLDNITVQLVEFAVTPQGNRKPSGKRTALLISLAFVFIGVLIGTYWLFKYGGQQEKHEIAAPRVVELIHLGDVSFQKDAEILIISQDISEKEKATLVRLVGDDTDRRVSKVLSLDSLFILSKDTIKKEQIGNNNNCIALKFSQTYLADSLVFELKDSLTVYRFSLCVVRQLEEKKKEAEKIVKHPVDTSTVGISGMLASALGTSDSKNSKSEKRTQDRAVSTTNKGENKEKQYSVNAVYDKNKPFLIVYLGKSGRNTANRIYLSNESHCGVFPDEPIQLNSSSQGNKELAFSFSKKPTQENLSIKIAVQEKDTVTINVKVNPK